MESKTINECRSCGYTTENPICDVCKTSKYIVRINKKGITLIEMMIVLLVIGILSAISIPNILRARIETNHTIAKATLNTIGKALEIYYIENGQYPEDIDKLFTEKYVRINYLEGEFKGYSYRGKSYSNNYLIIADPVSNLQGKDTFSLMTGGVLH
jgi:prepilin-type N-terminal cleavage/methylation domain-containing protein